MSPLASATFICGPCFYFISFSWNAISQQACVSTHMLSLSCSFGQLSPTFPQVHDWLLLPPPDSSAYLLLQSYPRTLGKGFPWNNMWNSSINLACCQTPQKRQVVCWCRIQLDLLTKDCFYSISNSSPKFPLSVLVTDALHLKPCLPIYLLEPTEFVLVLNPFPNIFVFKEESFFFFLISRDFNCFIHCMYSWVKC